MDHADLLTVVAAAVIDVIYVLSFTFVVGRTTRKSSRKSFYVPFTPLLRLQLTGCLLLNWFLSGQAGFSRYWWSRRSNAQNLCYHLATGVPTAIRIFLTGVPTCSRVYLQLYRFFSRVCLRAHGCTFSYTKFSHGCTYVLTGVPCSTAGALAGTIGALK
jgi:hypothetical protein